jgi:hypothetical protein
MLKDSTRQRSRDAASLLATVVIVTTGFGFTMGVVAIFSKNSEILIPLLAGSYVLLILSLIGMRHAPESHMSDLELIERVHKKKVIKTEHHYRFGKIVTKEQQENTPLPPTAEKIREIKESANTWTIKKSRDSRDDDSPSKLI